MNPAPAGTSKEATIGSEAPLTVECHVFACGHGDTILLCLPGNHWILIDCHLTKYDGVYDGFFGFLEQRNITRLEYIFQTHPDIDHFLGMVDILQYFSSDGRSVGYWCDSGPSSQQVREGLDPQSSRRYDQLQKVLDALYGQGKIKFRQVDQNGCLIGPRGLEGRVDLIPIAPDPSEIREEVRKGVKRIASNPEASLEANALSVILVLCVQDNGRHFHLLLGADPESKTLETALEVWTERASISNRPHTLDAVKVPHHGSHHSHYRDLCQMGGNGQGGKVAVVSAGTRRLLPERGVLADYLNNQWTLLITTKRGVRKPKNRTFRPC